MEDETSSESGTEEQASIDFTEGEGGGDSANPGDGIAESGTPEQTESRAPRTLAELKAAFEDGDDISDEENNRILLAAKKGYKSDEEVEAHIAKHKGQKPEGKAKEAPKTTDKDADKQVKPESVKAELPDALARLVKEINPTKPEPEEALKSLQTLKSDYRKKGERLNQLDGFAKQAGFESAEAVLDRAMKMEDRLEALLKTPEGRKQLLQAYQVQGDFDTAPAGKLAERKIPELDELDDEEFPQGGKIKLAMQKLAQDIESRVEAKYASKYGEVEKTFGEVKQKIAREEEFRRIDGLRSQALKDVSEIAKLAAEYDMTDWALKDPAEKIFQESTYPVYKDGKKTFMTKKEAHPEWPTLQKILEVRRDQFLTSGAPKVSQWFGDMLLERKTFQKIKTDAASKATQNLLTKQRKAVQPNLLEKGKAVPVDTFRVPESEEDLEDMSEEHLKELRRRMMSGQLKMKA